MPEHAAAAGVGPRATTCAASSSPTAPRSRTTATCRRRCTTCARRPATARACASTSCSTCSTSGPTERVINKITPSAFTSSPIELILRTYGADGPRVHGRLDEHVRREHAARRIRQGLRLRPGGGRDRDRRAGVPRRRDPDAAAPLRAASGRPTTRSRTSRRASRRDRPRSAEGRGRRRWHVHRPHARRRRVGLGGRAQDREHPERSVAGDDGRPARALRPRRRGARRRRAAPARDDRRDEHRPRAQRLDDRDDHDPRVPRHHLHRSPPAAEDVLDLPGPPVAGADAGRRARNRHVVSERVVPPGDVEVPLDEGEVRDGGRARCARRRSTRSPSASCSRSSTPSTSGA